MTQKIIKDSIHGYIELEERFYNIINTPEFQRLKSIEQGSFRVLYPAARHDRFIHSLGTYHLARKFSEYFIENIREDIKIFLSEDLASTLINTFLYAALLHDIGHAPFSHTTEKFFKEKHINKEIAINKNLSEAIKRIVDKERYNIFKCEFEGCSPSPHEIMSATILINNSEAFLQGSNDSIDLELAARMVIGCTYDYNNLKSANENEQNEYGVKNCFIRLLNSQTVDVDKLDYITRDTQMSGFLNVPIDIDRLVRSVTAIKDEDGFIYPAFRKNALSVIDNVFRAKTEQGLWMVSHPVVLYDSELLSYCITLLNNLINKKYIEKVFSIDALSMSGIVFNRKRYRLLNDIDVNSDLRQFYDSNKQIQELYDMKSRCFPLWKSYYEYKHLFGDYEDKVFGYFKSFMDYMKNSGYFTLNNESCERICSDDAASTSVKEVVIFLQDFFKKKSIDLDLVILPSTNSFSPKFDPNYVYISFPKLPPNQQGKNYEKYSDLKSEIFTENKRLFYVYTRESLSTDVIKSFVLESKTKALASKKRV